MSEPNVTISQLPLATQPLDDPNTFFEVSVIEAGEAVSRKISLEDIASATGLDASFITVGANAQLPNERVLTAGANIAIVDGGPNSTITISAATGFPLLAPDGSAGAPSYSFLSETDGGMYWDGSNIAWSSLATPVFRIDDTGLSGNNVSPTFYIVTDASPSDTIPIYTVNNDNDTGIGFAAPDSVSIIAGGIEIARAIEDANDQFAVLDGSAAGPAYSFINDLDTGFFLGAIDILGLAAGGLLPVQIDGSNGVGNLQVVITPGGPQNNPTFPALAFGDGDSGFLESSDDQLGITLGTVQRWFWATDVYGALMGDGPALVNEAASNVNPTLIPDRGSLGSGIGGTGSTVSVIVNGTEIARAIEGANDQLAIAQSGSSSIPDLTSLGDLDTGFRWPADNTTVWIGGGSRAWNFSTAKFFSQFSNGPALMNEVSSRTNPTVVPDHADEDTGIGSGGSDELSIIAGGVEAIRVEETVGNAFITYFGPILVPNGAAGAAAYAFDGDDDTGFFSPGADSVALTAGGVEAVRYTEAGGGVVQRNQNDVGLTASVTQTQAGGLALLSSYNEIATVANPGDALTAFSVAAGDRLIVINNGANDLQLFPAVGDDIGAGVDTAITIAAGEVGIFQGRDATDWDTLYNAAPTPGGGGPGGVLPAGTVADSGLKWDGVSTWVEETQVRLTGGLTGLQVFDVGLTDNIRIGHDGTNSLVRTTGSTEVIFGGGGAGPSTFWRFEERVRVPDGSAALPSLVFFTGGTDGFFRNAFPGISVSVTGVEQMRITNADTEVYSDDFILAPNIGADRVTFSVSPVTDVNDLRILTASLTDIHWRGTGGERFVLEEFNLAMEEKAAAPADVTGIGQFWARTETTGQSAMFTGENGIDKGLANDAVQARRTTDFTLGAAFADVTLDATDIETDADVVEHDNVNTDDIDIHVTGIYRIHYGAVAVPDVTDNRNLTFNGRVRLNDGGTGIVGSVATTGFFNDSSLDGEQMRNRLDITFYASLTAGDFVTLQLSETFIAGTNDTNNAQEVVLTVERVQ